MLAAPASLSTTPERNSRPSLIRTPVAFAPSSRMAETSALVTTAPPAHSICGTMAAAIAPAPPTG